MEDEYKQALLYAATTIRGLADIINRRQVRPSPKQRRVWADKLWATADDIDIAVAKADGTWVDVGSPTRDGGGNG